MTSDSYKTIVEPGSAQTRVLGSRFLGSAQPASCEADTEQRLSAERKRYHDATHWCFAARLGTGPALIERASDAGEPKGTAGVPILHEIQARDLTNALVIVTRYFGGTKLGTGNLARAYADCAAKALNNAVEECKRILMHLCVECPYDLQALVYHVAQRFHATVGPGDSAAQASFLLAVPASEALPLTNALSEEGRGRIAVRPAES